MSRLARIIAGAFSGVVAAPWYNPAWGFRNKITIDQTAIDADLTDYTVTVNLARSDILGNARADKNDIVFTASDMVTKLPHELVSRSLLGIGGWTWYNSLRALYHNGKTFIGTIDNAGNLYVGQYTHNTAAIIWTQLTAALEVDDHDNPALVVRPSDNRLVAVYAKHGVDALLRYKISTNAEDATAWGTEQTVTMAGNVAYANPIILPADNNACYVFSRVWEVPTDSNWTYRRTTDYSTWDASVEFWDSGAFQQYINVARNGNNRIDFFASDKHPDNDAGNCNLYHFYAQHDGSTLKFYNSAGVEQTLPLDTTKATLVYDASSGEDGWNHQIAIGADGFPRVLFQKRVSTTGTGDMRLMFARWNGTSWTTPVEITALGGYVYAGEASYTGNSCFDGADTNIVYLGKQVAGVYEIQKWATSDNGSTWSKVEDITTNSSASVQNLRPFSPLGHNGTLACLWCGGRYTSYTNYFLSTYCYPPLKTQACVKVPSISGTVNTDIYVYYGNASATDQQDRANAWDANYQAVYHLNTVPVTVGVPDSTANARNGTKLSWSEPMYLGAGYQFDGVNDNISLGTQLNMAGWTGVTLESYLNYDGTGIANDEHQVFSNFGTVSDKAGIMVRIEPTAGGNLLECYAIKEANTQVGGSVGLAVTPNTDAFIGMVYDTTTLRGYVNGVEGGTTYATGAALDATASSEARIGDSPHNATERFGGAIYETRISNVARSEAWMKATAINLRTPASLYSFGVSEAK